MSLRSIHVVEIGVLSLTNQHLMVTTLKLPVAVRITFSGNKVDFRTQTPDHSTRGATDGRLCLAPARG